MSTRKKLLTRVLPIVGLLIVSVLFIVPQVQANTNQEHCITHLTPIDPNSGASSEMTLPGYYATPEEAWNAT